MKWYRSRFFLTSTAICAVALVCTLIFVDWSCAGRPLEPMPVVELPPEKPAKKLLVVNSWGTLRGKVIYDGEPPPVKVPYVGKHPHGEHCYQSGLRDETWVVNKESRGVANVVVALRPPEGFVFPDQPAHLKTWPDEVRIEQPYCVFSPRVSVMYCLRYSAELEGTSSLNPPEKYYLGPKPANGAAEEAEFLPRFDRQVLTLRCDYHRWMRGFVHTFDHPYAAVTNANGEFEIRNAPAGMELEVVVWHEIGEVVRQGDGGSKVKLPPNGVATLEFLAKPRKE
jgi:hypothetical protein